jgi:hypothetical protein
VDVEGGLGVSARLGRVLNHQAGRQRPGDQRLRRATRRAMLKLLLKTKFYVEMSTDA